MANRYGDISKNRGVLSEQELTYTPHHFNIINFSLGFLQQFVSLPHQMFNMFNRIADCSIILKLIGFSA